MWFLVNLFMAIWSGAPLTSACPVDWRGVPAREAIAQLGARLSVEFVVDDSVDAKQLEKDIRLSASHLTGEQAFRWAARLAGLEAIEVEGAILLISPQRGKVGQDPPYGLAGVRHRPADDRAAWAALRGKRAAVAWKDTPLSRIGKDISAGFGVDAIFHEAILAEPVLITLEHPDVDLEAVCRTLSNQTAATAEYLDGAIWIHPASSAGDKPPDSMPALLPDHPDSTGGGQGQPGRVGLDPPYYYPGRSAAGNGRPRGSLDPELVGAVKVSGWCERCGLPC